MFSSKRKTTRLAFTALSALILSACWSAPRQPTTESSGSTFKLQSVSREHVLTQTADVVWKLPQKKIYTIKACLQNNVTQGNVANHDFIVRLDDGEIQKVQSGADSCVRWNETVSFNYFAKPKYVVIERTIEGQGVHRGQVKVEMAINPWAPHRGNQEPEFVPLLSQELKSNDIARGKEAVIQALNGTDKSTAQVWLSDLRLGVTKLKGLSDGIQLSLDFDLQPTIRVMDHLGSQFEEKLRSGKFRVYATLIATGIDEDQSKKLILTPDLSVQEGDIRDGRLKIIMNSDVKRRVSKGRIELALRLVPTTLDRKTGKTIPLDQIQSFDGVYLLGEYDSLIGNKSPSLQPAAQTEGFTYESYLQSTANFDELKVKQEAFDLETFEMGILDPRFMRVQPGETATTRTVEFRVRTCVTDPLHGRRVRNEKFTVVNDGVEEAKWTDNEGCLQWIDEVSHKYYQPENLFFPKVTISHSSGYKRDFTLAINPWDDKFTFGQDVRVLDPKYEAKIKNRKTIPSRFFLSGFSYHTTRLRYEIDEHMNLEVRKAVLLEIMPNVLRYNSIVQGRSRTEELRDGIYLMKVAIQKDYLDPAAKGLITERDSKGSYVLRAQDDLAKKNYVSVVKKLVRVNNGKIRTPVEFSMRDLRLLRFRSNFVVQLEPIEEKKLQIANLKNEQLKKKHFDGSKESSEENTDQVQEREKRVQALIRKISALHSTVSTIENEHSPFELTPALEAELRKEGIFDQTLDSFAQNDFTLTPAAPVGRDLNDLIDPNSGLEKRTFVGPIVFLSYSFSSTLRPTDNLDEIFCDVVDCDEFKQGSYNDGNTHNKIQEYSKYYGSIVHLANRHVDDLIEEKKKLEVRYQQEMKARSLLSNFLDMNQLGFVSLGDERLERFKESCKSIYDPNCLVETTENSLDKNQLVDSLNSYLPRHPVSLKDLENFVETRKASPNLAAKICVYWFNQFLGLQSGAQTYSSPFSSISSAKAACARNLIDGNSDAMAVEQKFRIAKTGQYRFRGGKSMNLNVGSSFNLNANTSFTTGLGGSLAPGKLLGLLGGFVNLSARVALDWTKSISDGTSISEQTFLAMQMATFDVELKSYRKCLVLRLNPEFVRSHNLSRFTRRDSPSDQARLAAGLMVCKGELETQPIPVRERYYYFTQHFTEGDMLDSGDPYNHPWLLQMRGIRDLRLFISEIRAQPVELHKTLTPVVVETKWPIQQMIKTYLRTTPTSPGLYTVLDEKDERAEDFPWNDSPMEGFKRDVGLGLGSNDDVK